jgi:predicted Zn finger-like uncharacterized protein
MSNEIDARCPVCKEWWKIPKSDIGTAGRCGNCGQYVKLVPRSSAAVFWRNVLVVAITFVVVIVAIWIYKARVNEATRTLGGNELPNLTTR